MKERFDERDLDGEKSTLLMAVSAEPYDLRCTEPKVPLPREF